MRHSLETGISRSLIDYPSWCGTRKQVNGVKLCSFSQKETRVKEDGPSIGDNGLFTLKWTIVIYNVPKKVLNTSLMLCFRRRGTFSLIYIIYIIIHHHILFSHHTWANLLYRFCAFIMPFQINTICYIVLSKAAKQAAEHPSAIRGKKEVSHVQGIPDGVLINLL